MCILLYTYRDRYSQFTVREVGENEMRKKNVFRITATCEKFAIIYIHILKTLYYYCNGKERREWNTNTNWLAVWHKIIIIMHSSSSSSSSSKLHEKKKVCQFDVRLAFELGDLHNAKYLDAFFFEKKYLPMPYKKKTWGCIYFPYHIERHFQRHTCCCWLSIAMDYDV